MAGARRIDRRTCCGVVIDVQDFFLASIDEERRRAVTANTAHFARLLGYLQIPLVVTVEKPVERKGLVPEEIDRHFAASTARFEKEFFDLTKEREIRDHISGLGRKQAIIAGCETDVCVLQSCLGLIGLGYEVFLVEELLFSSSDDVDAAMARLESAVSYKTLYYELMEAIEGDRHWQTLVKAFGPFPATVPDAAAE
jgi:isochorismate hydrolase